jgi:hypothetical protein
VNRHRVRGRLRPLRVDRPDGPTFPGEQPGTAVVDTLSVTAAGLPKHRRALSR